MSKAWMPLYVGDYLADTGHLTTLQHGAYLLLIMHYWQHGSLPDDAAAVARICRLTGRVWSSNCLAIASMFEQPGWHHKRIDAELQRAKEISDKRKVYGAIGGRKNRGLNNPNRHLNGKAIAKPTVAHNHNHQDKKEGETGTTLELVENVKQRGWA